MNGPDIPRTFADRLYSALLLAYPADFRDRFGAGMRYAFVHDRDAARAAGPAAYLRFWLSTLADTLRSGLAEDPNRGRAGGGKRRV